MQQTKSSWWLYYALNRRPLLHPCWTLLVVAITQPSTTCCSCKASHLLLILMLSCARVLWPDSRHCPDNCQQPMCPHAMVIPSGILNPACFPQCQGVCFSSCHPPPTPANAHCQPSNTMSSGLYHNLWCTTITFGTTTAVTVTIINRVLMYH